MGKHLNRTLEAMWNDEDVPTYRHTAIKAAIELGYDDQCLKDIYVADTITAISRAMTNGRHRLEKQEEEDSKKPAYKIKPISEERSEDIPIETKEKTFIPASFGVDTNHTDRYYDHCVLMDQEHQQLDLLQEECAELIKAVAKVKRMQELSHKNKNYIDSKDVIEKWYEARANLAEELAHVAISSAVVARVLGVSQDEIDAVVKRKDDLLTNNGVDLANGLDLTVGGVYNHETK